MTTIADHSSEAVVWMLQREMGLDLPVVLDIDYDGDPVSKSRPRFTGKGSKTRAYTPERTRTAEARIALLTRQAGVRGGPDGEHSFGLFAKFFCGTWQRRDVDNMIKLVSDALTGIVWVDDSQVTEMSGSVERGVINPRTHLLIYRTLTQAPPTTPCRTCGKPIRKYKSSAPKFCSRECTLKSKRAPIMRTCETCTNEFEVKPYRKDARFCSTECQSAAGRVALACSHCDRAFTKQRCHVRAANYCSDECMRDARAVRRRGIRKGDCADCGGPVSRKEYTRCSDCDNKRRGTTGNPRISGEVAA